MKIYNVLHRRKEEFVPIDGNNVKMYVCGMTVNGEPHLGHARQVITFDMISQYLRYKGYNVTYASNYTDIDDRIINQSKEMGISPLELADKRIDIINKVMSKISVTEPNYRPRVTKCIPEIIAFVSDLIEKGYAYPTENGDVYFCVKKYKGYGQLSNRKIDELINSVRIESSEEKNDPLDFALWKAVKKDEFGWDSPWGKGRPGWHIECSTMIKKFLGDKIDIHGGGKDLVFPHHENELAQSTCENSCELANFWVHNGLIVVDGQKMSKSMNNFVLLKDLLEIYNPEVIRYAFILNHYTSTLDLGDNAFKQAEKSMYYFYNVLNNVNNALQGKEYTHNDNIVKIFESCMDDDFNSAKLLAELFTICGKLGKYKDLTLVASLKYAIDQFKDILGLFRQDPQEFLNEVKAKYVKQLNLNVSDIEKQIELRNLAKQEKNYAESDRIRNELDAKGIMLKDTIDGTIWDIKQLY